jgi:hypothetical protein
MKTNLYELSYELAEINDQIIDAEGVISPDLERRLDDSGLAFNQKVEGIIKWCIDIEGKEAALDKEIARLQARKKVSQNLRSRLKAYMTRCMTFADIKKMEFDLYTISLRKNPPSCEVVSPEIIPAEYTTTKTEVIIDKGRILADLKANKDVPGAKLITDKTHLRIK